MDGGVEEGRRVCPTPSCVEARVGAHVDVRVEVRAACGYLSPRPLPHPPRPRHGAAGHVCARAAERVGEVAARAGASHSK